MNDQLQLLAVSDVAKHLRCSEQHVYDLLASGRLKGVRRHGKAAWRVPAQALTTFLGLPKPGTARAATDLLDLPTLCRLSGFGNRQLQTELAAGRLKGRIVGRRWLVTVDHYKQWSGIR